MLTINTNWKAAFSQPGVSPLIHVRILDLSTFTDASCTFSSGSTTIAVTTTAAIVEGMTVTSTTFEISETTTGPGISATLTFGKVYQMMSKAVNRRYHSDRFNADPIVLKVVPVSVSMDALTREPQVGELNIDIADDGTFRRLMGTLSLKLKRKKVEVRVGAAHLSFSDFQKVFVGELFDIAPSSGIISLKVRDAWQGVSEAMTRHGWINDHPLQAVKQAIIDGSALTSDDFDTNSFDPDHSSKADIGHYCVTAYKHSWPSGQSSGASPIEFQGEPTGNLASRTLPLKPIVTELVRGMYGFIFVDSDGKMRFLHYDKTDSVVRHFTTADYSDFRQESPGDVINDITAKVGYGETQQEFRLQNAASIIEYGVYENDLGDSPYSSTSTYAFLTSNDTALTTSDTTLTVFAGQTNGLSGTRGFASGASLGANAGVQVSRPLYLLNQKEIIKCTTVAENSTRELWRAAFNDPYGGAPTFEVSPDIADLSQMTRGFSSTVANSIELDDAGIASDRSWEYMRPDEVTPLWWREPLWDITMLYDYGVKLLERYQHGLPMIKFTAPLSHFDLELGDFITIDAAEFLHRNIDGLDNGTKWEIVGKDASFFDGFVGIEFSCAMVNETSVTVGPLLPYLPPMKIMDPFLTFGGSQISNIVTGNSVRSGLIASISAASGKLDLTAGTCNAGGVALKFNLFTSPSLPALRDCYVGVAPSGMMVVSTVASGGHPPPTGPNETSVCKAVTGGASVVSAVTDLRSLGGTTSKNLDPDAGIHSQAVPNPGFSAWTLGPTHAPDGWHLGLTSGDFQTNWTRGTDSRSGNLCLVSKGNVGVASALVSDLFPIEAGTPYMVTVWLKGTIGDDFNIALAEFVGRSAARLVLTDLGKGGGYVSIDTTTDYKKYKFEVAAHSTAKYGRLEISRPASIGSDNDGDIFIDSVAVKESPDRFRAVADADQTITAGFLSILEFGNQVYDNSGIYNPSTHKFTARVPGLYSFTVSVPFTPVDGSGTIVAGYISLFVSLASGGPGRHLKKSHVPTVLGTDHPRHAHFSVHGEYLEAGDSAACYAFSDVSSTTNWEIEGGTLDASGWFEGWKID